MFISLHTLNIKFQKPCMCAWSLGHVLLFTTPLTAACQAPLSIGILQARMQKWVAMPSSRGSSQLRNRTCISYASCIGR